MSKLVSLSKIPHAARSAEAKERAKWPTREMALDSASYEILAAPGCYGGAFPPSHGWVLTRDAAEAIAGQMTHMPGNTSHRRQDYQERAVSTDALGDYIEAVARGVPQTEALAKYIASRAAE